MQIHTVREREIAAKRHLRIHGENEDCRDQAARRIETHPRTTETGTEDQGTRTLLAHCPALIDVSSHAAPSYLPSQGRDLA